MPDRVRGFDWDLHDVGHIARHGVEAAEVEEAVAQRNIVIQSCASEGEDRWKLFGKSAEGRYLTLVFTIRGELLRPITAHTMNQNERRIYAPEIDAK